MASEPRAGRLYHLDAARAIMLLLGIPFHVCEVYRVSGGFGIDSPDNSFIASLVSGLIHCFRMPAFFLLSGYFAAMVIGRRGAGVWLRGRLVRLGVPLIATTLTLGLLEQATTIWFNDRVSFATAFRDALNDPVATWINHRWFLVVLILYCASLAGAGWLVQSGHQGDRWLDRRPERRALFQIALLGILCVVPFAAIVAGKTFGEWVFISPEGKQYANLYIKYGFFFVSGVVLYAAREGLRRFARLSPATIVGAATFIGLYLVTYFAFYPAEGGDGETTDRVMRLARIGVEALAGFYGARLFFAAVQRTFDRESRVIAYFVDASLCIYLVHEIFLIAVSGYFLELRWPPVVEIALICGVVLAGSVLVYELARRTSVLSLPLNGGPFNLPLGWRSRRMAEARSNAG